MADLEQTLTTREALDRAAQYYDAGRLADAEHVYQHILRADPNQHVALAMLGFIAMRIGKHDIAVDLITKSIEINPDSAEAHHNLGISLSALGRTQDAAASYRRALARNPELAETHNNLGLTQCKLGNVHDGIAEFRRAVAIRSDFFDAHVNLGVALCSLGRFDDGFVSYKNALGIQPDNIVALMNLGDSLRGLGRLEEALDAYQAVVDLDPKHAGAYNEMGNLLRTLGKLEEAVTSFRKALAAQPDFAMARRNEGSTLQELGRLDEAIRSLEKADTSLSRTNLLECIYARRDKERFYRELERIMSEDRTNVGVAAISAFASNQFKCADPYPFCANAMDFISVKNLSSATQERSKFFDALRKQLLELDLCGGNQPLLHCGFQSAPTLFVDPRGSVADLHQMLRTEVADYVSSHAASDCLYIKEWPQNYSMTAWYVLMQQGGHLTLHNHPAGWLSGVIYLEMPAKDGDEGNIEFGLHGNNLPILSDDYPRETIPVTEGDLVMFPSSLFHRTVPFHSKRSRLCISFDVNPH